MQGVVIKKSNNGFTLIELMIVVAIIGILASIAFPQYNIYTVRARVTEGLSLAGPAKLLVVENAIAGSSSFSFGATAFVPPTSNNVSDITIDASNGAITVVFGTQVGIGDNLILRPISSGAPLSIGIIPVGVIDWQCDTAASSLPVKYRPPSCR